MSRFVCLLFISITKTASKIALSDACVLRKSTFCVIYTLFHTTIATFFLTFLPFENMPTIQLQNSSQPDITYLPDPVKYKSRIARRLKEEQLESSVPEGFPEQLEGPKLWKGSDYEGKENEWVYELTEQELKEIDDAVHEFEATGKHFSEISKETFPLPTAGPHLKQLTEDNVVEGRGFIVIRGINPDKYTREQNIIAYTGVCAYVGKRGLQHRHVLGECVQCVFSHYR